MSAREWTEDMGEISGFGGSYEAACRAMVLAGVAWLEANPTKQPLFGEVENIFGSASSTNADAKELEKVLVEAAKRCGDSPTGAMFHAAVHHVVWVQAHGWDAYVAARRKHQARRGGVPR